MPSAKVADGSCTSLPSLQNGHSRKVDANVLPIKIEKTEEERQKDLELYRELKKRKNELEEKLLAKLEELREVCIKEAEITGVMPKEIYKTLMPGEAEPKVKRRVGTSFTLSEEVFKKPADANDKLAMLETDVELHRKIVAAAERLAKDKSTNKSVRKKRQKDFLAATQKLRGLEFGLSQLRLSASKPDVSTSTDGNNGGSWMNYPGHSTNSSKLNTRTGGSLLAKSCPTTPRGSIPDVSSLADYTKSEAEDEDDDILRREHSRRSQRNPSTSSSASSHYSNMIHRIPNDGSTVSSVLPPSPNRRPVSALTKLPGSHRHDAENQLPDVDLDNPLERQGTSGMCDNARLPLYENIGYKSCASYKSSYRQTNFPTLNDPAHLKSRQRAHSEHNLPLQKGLYDSSKDLHCASNRVAIREQDGQTLNAYNSNSDGVSWNCRSVEHGLNNLDENEQSRMHSSVADANRGLLIEESSFNGYKPVRLMSNGVLRLGGNTLNVGMPARHSGLSASYSYTDGLSTSSLDRRATRNKQASCMSVQNGQQGALNAEVESSNSVNMGGDKSVTSSGTQLLSRLSLLAAPRITTTFPVSKNGGIETSKPFEMSDVQRYRSSVISRNNSAHQISSAYNQTASPRLSPSHRPPPPTYTTALRTTAGVFVHGNGTSLSKVTPANTDPHMEALLDYYKDAANRKGKTATIV